MRDELFEKISGLLARRGRALVALEGMSASGKTTLASELARVFPANVYHMDDFFLPAGQRQENWQSVPAGNMDLDRFLREVLGPLARGGQVLYRPYRCAMGAMGETQLIRPRPLEVIEGAYCAHPRLGHPYDLTVFVRVDEGEQQKRILRRNGPEGLKRFSDIWIPMEARYFAAFGVEAACDLRYTPITA